MSLTELERTGWSEEFIGISLTQIHGIHSFPNSLLRCTWFWRDDLDTEQDLYPTIS